MVLVPQGPGLTPLSVSITFLALSWVFVAVRFAVRYRKRCIGADDWLMAAGLVSSVVMLQAICYRVEKYMILIIAIYLGSVHYSMRDNNRGGLQWSRGS